MAKAKLEFLGVARITAPEGPVTGLGRKAVALLAYLAHTPGKAYNRDQLAALLWPDRFDEQARQSLRQALTAARKAIGDALRSDEGAVSLDADRVWCDCAAFEAAAHGKTPEHWREAIALYHGDLLETLGEVSSEFDDWAGLERRRLRDAYLSCLEALARDALDAGRLEEAVAESEKLLTADPANEPGVRIALKALARLGRHSAALRKFETFKEALKRRLDAEPSPETLALLGEAQVEAQSGAKPERQPAPKPVQHRAPNAARSPPPWRFAALIGACAAAAIIAFTLLRPSLRERGFLAGGGTARASACAAAIGLPDPVPPSLAVLPLSAEGDAALEPFAAASTARISDLLTEMPGLTLKQIPASFSPGAETPAALAARLGATNLITGAVRGESGAIYASIQLIDGKTGAVLETHARRFEATPDARRAAQDLIAIAAAEAVQVRLTEGEQALHYYEYPTASLDVFQHLSRASQHFDDKSKAHNERARAEYEAARALDQHDPRAINGVAWTYLTAVFFGWSDAPNSDLARAKALAREAIAADPEFFYPHSLLGLAALIEGDQATARAEGEEAMRVSGGGADAAAILALILTYTGDPARSRDLIETAMRRRPSTYPAWYEWMLGRAARLNGAPDLALDCLQRARVRDVDFALPQVERTLSLADAGDLTRARREMVELMRAQGAGFTAESYCASPPYAQADATAHCVADLRRVGAP